MALTPFSVWQADSNRRPPGTTPAAIRSTASWTFRIRQDLPRRLGRNIIGRKIGKRTDSKIFLPIKGLAGILFGRKMLGKERRHLLDPTTAFKLTALGSGLDTLEQHLHRFLRHTQLDAIHWVNLHHHDVTFITLIRTQ
jgi:hypothetical protein